MQNVLKLDIVESFMRNRVFSLVLPYTFGPLLREPSSRHLDRCRKRNDILLKCCLLLIPVVR